MCEEKKLITKEIRKIYSIILAISIGILILSFSFVVSTFRLFIDYLSWHTNCEVISQRANCFVLDIMQFIGYEKFTFWLERLSFWVLILITPFEILSKNKEVNIVVYLILIGIYMGILVFINVYLVKLGMEWRIP